MKVIFCDRLYLPKPSAIYFEIPHAPPEPCHSLTKSWSLCPLPFNLDGGFFVIVLTNGVGWR